ncbi:MAG: methyltransferase [Candidatus Aminicenantes bacterium]|nr:methyltransferase [Candidatus Aminicenantes bacterium]
MKEINWLKEKDETLDSFYHGKVLILQKKKGYRFSVDAPLLADFIETKEGEELLEIGGGCGVISLLLSLKSFKHITCLEIQPSLADLARRNVVLNQLEGRITVVEGDIRVYQPEKKFDVIFSNPPYFQTETGFIGHNQERALARHEVTVQASDIIKKMAELLKSKGRIYLIYPIKRYDEIIALLKQHGFSIWRLRFVLPKADRPPRFFMVEAGLVEKPKIEMPPLILFDSNGQYTAEAKRIFAGGEISVLGKEKRGEGLA